MITPNLFKIPSTHAHICMHTTRALPQALDGYEIKSALLCSDSQTISLWIMSSMPHVIQG